MVSEQTAALRRALLGAADALRGHAQELSELDSKAGDGDLGITAVNISEAITTTVADSAELDSSGLLRSCGAAIADGAPSSCGTLVATGFIRAARALASAQTDGAELVADTLGAAQDGISERGKAAVGGKTILDAIAPTVASLREHADGGAVSALRQSVAAALDGAQATKNLVPSVGRAAWLADATAGHIDAGAQLFAFAWTGGVAAVQHADDNTSSIQKGTQ